MDWAMRQIYLDMLVRGGKILECKRSNINFQRYKLRILVMCDVGYKVFSYTLSNKETHVGCYLVSDKEAQGMLNNP